MEELNIFSCIKISNFLENNFENEEEENAYLQSMVICGKFSAHKLNDKYSFDACDFYLYTPLEKNKLFHSTMKSEDSFNSNLKWNENFFMKIRNSFTSSIKNGYFAVNYSEKNEAENKDDNLPENLNNEIDEALMENDIFDYLDLGEENKIIEKNKFFELKFYIEGELVTIFRLELNEVFAESPINSILLRAMEFEEKESEMLLQKIRQYEDSRNEFCKLNQQILEKEFLLEKNKREFLYKFYLLNNEKNKKIEELENLEIKKFNKNKKIIKNLEANYKEKKPIILKELINKGKNNDNLFTKNNFNKESEENIYAIFEDLD